MTAPKRAPRCPCGHAPHPRGQCAGVVDVGGYLAGCDCDTIDPHPFARPTFRGNDRCLTCGEYEEDGPHIAG
jgi:hypothetical protein